MATIRLSNDKRDDLRRLASAKLQDTKFPALPIWAMDTYDT